MEEILKFKCDTRNYGNINSWSLFNVSDLTEADIYEFDVNPIRDKLMNQDIIRVVDKKFVEIIHSSNRTLPVIPAILSFKKMYGKNGNKYMFKATPDDIRVPEFIVSSKVKNTGFNKKQKSKYIIIKFKQWKGRHPEGEIIMTIGDVEILPHFYEYMLYCKSLHTSLQKFTQNTMKFLRNTNEEKHIQSIIDNRNYNIENRCDMDIWDIITIDSKDSRDLDDAFSIRYLPQKKLTQLSIYISHVPIWIDSMNLWSSFTERISTIYLPDRKRPMLPTLLSDKLCSLQKGKRRIAFALDIFIDKNYKIKEQRFSNVAIKIRENIAYSDNASLLSDKTYTKVLNLVSEMNHHTRYKYCDKIVDSHDVILYLMVLMNYISAQKLTNLSNGIFRTIKLQTNYNIPDGVPHKVQQFVKGWNSSGGKYLKYGDGNYKAHDILELDAYVHITSPIRRLVDIINIIIIFKKMKKCEFINRESSKEFYDKWTHLKNIEYINTSMRSIRKLQNRCQLLERCFKEPEILERTFDGYCFDKIDRNDGLFQYIVYIPELNMINKFTGQNNIMHFEIKQFQLYLFKDEGTFKQKIKMNLID